MSKPWSEMPLWQKVWLGPRGPIYRHVGILIGHLGCTPTEFLEAAQKQPDYHKLFYENAVFGLTVYAAREAKPPRYELHANAKKTLWILIGPPPDHPEYVHWWTGRLVSVRLARQEGKEPEYATEPPVPLPEEKTADEKVPEQGPAKKKRARKK